MMLRRLLTRLRRSTSGLALTEFALTVPIMTMLGIGGVEMASFVNANMRLSQIALSVADNTGRVRGQIDVTDVDAAMIGARIAGESIRFAQNGRVILSMIEVNGQAPPNAGQYIRWQRCFGAKNATSSFGVENDGRLDASRADGFGPTGKKIVAAPGSGVMFVEVVYDYQPIFPVNAELIFGLRGRLMRYTAAFPVRERLDNNLNNGFALPANRQRLCSTFSAT